MSDMWTWSLRSQCGLMYFYIVDIIIKNACSVTPLGSLAIMVIKKMKGIIITVVVGFSLGYNIASFPGLPMITSIHKKNLEGLIDLVMWFDAWLRIFAHSPTQWAWSLLHHVTSCVGE